MLDFLEVEEFVGRHWHRWASSAASYPDHPEAAVRLETLRPMLGVFSAPEVASRVLMLLLLRGVVRRIAYPYVKGLGLMRRCSIKHAVTKKACCYRHVLPCSPRLP